MFVNDESGSIGADNYQKSLQFMVDVMKDYKTEIDSGDVRVGVITYSNYVNLEIPLEKHTYNYLANTIMGLKYRGGSTYTGAAIDKGHDEISKKSLSATPKIIMVITDGKSADDVKTPSDAARKDGITCMAVGVGNYKESELMDIAGQDSSLVFEVTDYDALESFTKKITETICNIGTVQTGKKVFRACEHQGTKTLQCPKGYEVKVKFGYYGRKSRNVCPDKRIKTTKCQAKTSNNKLKSLCNGKQSCSINPSNSVFGDPCGGTVKYVELTYVCKRSQTNKYYGSWNVQQQSQSQSSSSGSWQSQSQSQSQSSSQGSVTVQGQSQSQASTGRKVFRACEHQGKKVMKCPKGYTMKISNAFYGRKNKNVCPSKQIKTVKCAAKTSQNKIKSMCNGKEACTINPSNSVFGDPCGGTVKYVQVAYTCVRKRQSSFKKFYACEHKGAKTVSCPKGTTIKVSNAFYGRKTRSICPSNQIKTLKCAAKGSSGKIKKTCNGKSACTINPSNGVFGDPCGGTVKYVEVNYQCVPTKQSQSQSQSQGQVGGSIQIQHQSQSQGQIGGGIQIQHQSQSQGQGSRPKPKPQPKPPKPQPKPPKPQPKPPKPQPNPPKPQPPKPPAHSPKPPSPKPHPHSPSHSKSSKSKSSKSHSKSKSSKSKSSKSKSSKSKSKSSKSHSKSSKSRSGSSK